MAATPTSLPQRMSRYRSQRTAQEAPARDATRAPQTALPTIESAVDEQFARRKSRYHRTDPNNGAQQTLRPKTAPAEAPIDVVQRRQSKRESQLPPIVQPNLARKPSARRYRDSYGSPPLTPEAQSGATDPQARRVGSDEMNWDDGADRRRRLKERYTVRRDSGSDSPVAPPPAHTKTTAKELLAPPKAKPVQPPSNAVLLDGPPASGDIRATRSMSALPKFVDSEDEEEEEDAGCFKLFRRKKVEPVPYAQEKTQILRPKASKTQLLRPKSSREKPTIKPGGGGVVPGIDAPISAVNAGDRQVMVVCGKSKAIFPVTPTTTPVDIMKSASKCMPGRIDVQSAVLLEDFSTVGVQRPLRRYEHIRDVMNSWDTDNQNSLILVDPGTGTSEAELSVSGVPQEKPGDESWLLEFSQKVGKWDKRIITLKSDGQITQQKDNKPQEQTNLCHLSDFDIYRPTQEKVRKKIKPPKRFCFAIKSQQKTAMFESTYDFVHFFCTNDRPTADAFYMAVQEWRSWYLVNVMGEGRKPRQTKGALEKALKELGIDDDFVKTNKRGESFEAQYQLPSLKPLIDLGRIEKPPLAAKSKDVPSPVAAGFTKSSNQLDTTISPERRTSTVRKQQYPPGSMSNRAQLGEDEPLVNLSRKESVHRRRASLDSTRDEALVSLGRKESVDRRRPSLDERTSNSEEFAPTGLLGRSYSQRQKDSGLGRNDSVNRRRPSIDRTKSNPEEFAETGLLGSEYSQRRKECAERDNQRANRFTSGPNLLNIGYDSAQDDHSPRKSLDDIQRRHSTRPQHARKNSGDGGLQRTNSRKRETQMPKPLVDLTPQYREPPQHTRKGKGFTPDKVGEGGLIDNATSPEDPLGIPPSTDWRAGRNAANAQNLSNTVSRNGTNARSTKRPQTARETPAAFTGEGLLAGAQAQQGWGTNNRGRGVMDGSRAKGPMVDMSIESKFAHGSLVAKVEAAEALAAPIIDRSRED